MDARKYLCYSKIIELIDDSEDLKELEVKVNRFFNSQIVIKLNCNCGASYEIKKDNNAPENAFSMGCNWCPKCEDSAKDYYKEWYNLKNK